MNNANFRNQPLPQYAASVALWILQITTAAVFLAAGFFKLFGNQTMVDAFTEIGIGQWFRYLTGAIEIVAAAMLFVPRLIVAGALLLVGTMVGAVAAHLFIIGGSPLIPLTLMVFNVAIFLGRTEQPPDTEVLREQ